MAKYIKGEAVANATSYTLHNKNNSYKQLAEQTENLSEGINFNLDELALTPGEYALVVQAHASEYESSEYSNEIAYIIERELINLYSSASAPAQKWYVGNTWTVDSSNTKVILAKNTPIATSSALIVDMIPVESGKTYSLKLYNAPTTIKKSDDTEIPYYGIIGMFFHQTIDGKQSIRYAHTMTGSFGEQVSYWNTSKYPSYTGDIPISESNVATSTFAINNEHNLGVIKITNLSTNAINTSSRQTVFKGASAYTQSAKIEIIDESITHISILFGNPTDNTYVGGGVPTSEGFTTAINTIKNGLVIVEGDELPAEYLPSK